MEPGQVYGIDELAHASGLTAPNLLRQLTEWELRGLVRKVASGGFIRAS
jgi:predicted Rossmann fold nucleotide-binding protein DprA/Smf involved in DNA uptake